MPKMMLHNADARAALARGVEKLTAAVRGTLGPKGTNVIIDRPIGTPIVTRDGVSIAAEVELEDRFENMGAQVVREASMQTSEAAGDGTTTATVLANAIVQEGVRALADGASAVDLVEGVERAVALVADALARAAVPVTSVEQVVAVAANAATEPALGRLVAEAIDRVGADGVITVEHGPLGPTTLDVVEGMAFDRGYVSRHMATDPERAEAVLDDAYLLLTDQKVQAPAQLAGLRTAVAATGRPLLVVADELAPDVIASLLGAGDAPNSPPNIPPNGSPNVPPHGSPNAAPAVAVHPPEYGHWRQAMLEDIAVLTGGRVLARDLGLRLEDATLADLGRAGRVRVRADATAIERGGGAPEAVRARRALVQRQYEQAPPNIERDKLQQRLARLAGGTAVLRAGGATPVEQKRRAALLDDALSAARGAVAEGVVAGGGTALAQGGSHLIGLIASSAGGVRDGAVLVQRALSRPLATIAENAGHDAAAVVAQVLASPPGVGFDARTGEYGDLVARGVMDPLRVTASALRNATSVATLVLTTNVLIADRPEVFDPTAGPALGGGAELLGRA